MKIFFKLWFPCVVYFGIVSWLSHLPAQDELPFFPFQNFDKFLHFLEYFFFGLLLARAFYGQHRLLRLKYRWFVGVIISVIFFASLDEWHQSFVPGREMSFWDGVFDTFGVITACVVFLLAKQLKATKKNLHIDILKEKKFVYRLYLLLPVLILIFPKLYFSSQTFAAAVLTPNGVLISDMVYWSFLGIFWSRFWMWEVWWCDQKVLFQILGIAIGTAFLVLDLFLQGFSFEKLFLCEIAFLTFYGLYQFGMSLVKKSLAIIYQEPHGQCAQKH